MGKLTYTFHNKNFLLDLIYITLNISDQQINHHYPQTMVVDKKIRGSLWEIIT